MQKGSRRRLVIGGVENERSVERPQRPVDFVDFNSDLLGLRLEGLRPLHRLADRLDALFGELDRRDEGRDVGKLLSQPASLGGTCNQTQLT
jgi:hypothetical protein